MVLWTKLTLSQQNPVHKWICAAGPTIFDAKNTLGEGVEIVLLYFGLWNATLLL